MGNGTVFFIFLSVVWVCESWLFSQGYNTLFHHHKTPEEKEIQRLKIELLKAQIEAEKAKSICRSRRCGATT